MRIYQSNVPEGQKYKLHFAQNNKTPNINQKIIYFKFNSRFFYYSKILSVVPRCGRYAVHSTSDNRGSATVEAVCIMPILLFAFWAFFSMTQIFIVENQVYQAAMNTADYLAEYAYIAEDSEIELLATGAAYVRLHQYLPDSERIEQYIQGGKYGILITKPIVLDEEGFITLELLYRVRIPVPVIGNLTMPIQVQIRQKAYVGYKETEQTDLNQRYVYLTEYSSVYHTTRSCSHLDLTVYPISGLSSEYQSLEPCHYCGDREAVTYYATATGDVYHTSLECSGLKRTVRRVPMTEAVGYAPCIRCGQ